MKKIGVMLPARCSVVDFRTCLESLYAKASRPDDLLLMVRFSDDDPNLEACREILQGFPNAHSVVGPRYNGYWSLDRLWNECAEFLAPQAEWLMIWNTDAIMRTFGWDEEVPAEHPPVCVVQFEDPHRNLGFLLVPSLVHERLGSITPHIAIDYYLNQLIKQGNWPAFRSERVFVDHRGSGFSLSEEEKAALRQKAAEDLPKLRGL